MRDGPLQGVDTLQKAIQRAYEVSDALSNYEHLSYHSRSDKLRILALTAEAEILTRVLEDFAKQKGVIEK